MTNPAAMLMAFWGGVVLAQAPLRLVQVAAGLTRPVLVVSPPGDTERLFVVEQTGRIRIIKNGALLATPFLDPTALPNFTWGGELGLLGLAFHPDYATNRQFFVFHGANPSPTNHVRRFTASAANPDLADPASGTLLLTLPMVYGNHNGGMLAFGPDRKLYISVGDGGSTPPLWPNDPQNHAQRGDSLLGKILRIDVDNSQPPLPYGIPPGNPFAAPGGTRDEIWALGLRNPWRFSFDRLTGDLWVGEVGGWAEQVLFEAASSPGGRNYGWACKSGSFCTGLPVCVCSSPALAGPLYEYLNGPNGQAIIGGFVYRGVAIPDLRGTYFFADHNRVEVWSLARTAQGTVAQLTNRTQELSAPPGSVIVGPTGFGEDARGELYLCDFSGRVFRIEPVTPVQVGVTPFGSGTAGCAGPHALTATGSPVVGNPAFGLRCAAAPPGSLGLMAIASLADVNGSDPLGFGFLAHLQLGSPLLLLFTIVSDASGVGRFAFAIPPTPTLAGAVLHSQSLWLWPSSLCTPSVSGWSSSPGLSLTLQP